MVFYNRTLSRVTYVWFYGEKLRIFLNRSSWPVTPLCQNFVASIWKTSFHWMIFIAVYMCWCYAFILLIRVADCLFDCLPPACQSLCYSKTGNDVKLPSAFSALLIQVVLLLFFFSPDISIDTMTLQWHDDVVGKQNNYYFYASIVVVFRSEKTLPDMIN